MRWPVALFALAACGRDSDDSLGELIAPEAAKLPGFQIVVELRGERILDTGYGFADLENRVPVTPDTVFCIGSISKQFGAAAIMQLVEAGKLSLDDPLAKFYPGYPRGERIKIRDLLRHTSGIEDFEYTGPWPKTMAVDHTDDEMIAMFRDRPPLFEPNTDWSYSTSNYFLLGKIVEKISGVSLADYLRAHVFIPAGLWHTRFCDAYDLIPDRAKGYDDKGGHWVPSKLAILTQFGIGGGLCSTARDLIAWQKALESGAIVSEASYRQMITAEPLVDGTPIGYGFGLFPSQAWGHRSIGHTGGVSGFSTISIHYVDDDLRIAAFTNTRDGGPPAMLVAKQLLGIIDVPPVPITTRELARYEATIPFAPSRVRFVVDGDHLSAEQQSPEGMPSPRFPFVYVGDDSFETADRMVHVHWTFAGDHPSLITSVIDGQTFYAKPLVAIRSR